MPFLCFLSFFFFFKDRLYVAKETHTCVYMYVCVCVCVRVRARAQVLVVIHYLCASAGINSAPVAENDGTLLPSVNVYGQ